LGKYNNPQGIKNRYPYEANRIGRMLAVLATKAELVKEIQKVVPEVDLKSLMRANKVVIQMIFDIVIK